MKLKISIIKKSFVTVCTILFYLQISIVSVSAQYKNLSLEVELGYNLSTGVNTPFWQKVNNFGTQHEAGNKAYFAQNALIQGYLKNKHNKYEIKTATWFTIDAPAKMIIPELNAKFYHKNMYLSIGRIREHHGLTDSTTSSGSVSVSHNALPIPQVKIGFSNYRKFLFKPLFIKGHYSHGWFGDQKWVSQYYLHQKNLSLRLGKEHAKVHIFGEIMHNTQWGGKPNYTIAEGDSRYINGRFATGWYSYKQVIFPLFNPKQDSSVHISAFDYENRIGNHFGQINMGGTINMRFSKITAYKEIPFETGQTFSSFTNIDDGLYGISYISKLTSPITKRLTIEYFQTTNQGMYRPGLLRLLGIKGKHYGRNRNNYYNHSQYLDGWSYNGHNIGSPFVIPTNELKIDQNQAYPSVMYLYNMVQALYLGAENNLWNLNFLTRISVSKNYSHAKYDVPNKQQFSGNITCQKELGTSKNYISLSVGIDRGDLLPENFGMRFSWRKLW